MKTVNFTINLFISSVVPVLLIISSAYVIVESFYILELLFDKNNNIIIDIVQITSYVLFSVVFSWAVITIPLIVIASLVDNYMKKNKD